MPDFQAFALALNGTASETVPDVLVSVKVVDSATGATVADLTGANSFHLVRVIGGLTAAQQRAIIERLALLVIHAKAG